MREMPRNEIQGLAEWNPRQENRVLEWAEDLPLVHTMPQPSQALVQADQAHASAEETENAKGSRCKALKVLCNEQEKG
jgi:hypothetical protein